MQESRTAQCTFRKADIHARRPVVPIAAKTCDLETERTGVSALQSSRGSCKSLRSVAGEKCCGSLPLRVTCGHEIHSARTVFRGCDTRSVGLSRDEVRRDGEQGWDRDDRGDRPCRRSTQGHAQRPWSAAWCGGATQSCRWSEGYVARQSES